MPTFIREGEYVTTTEAAGILGVSRLRVNQLTLREMLPSIHFPNASIIPLDAVLDRKQEREKAEAERLRRRETKLGEVSDDS